MFPSTLARFEGLSYVLLRVFAGLLFAFHGVQKVLGLLVTGPAPTLDLQKTIGGWIELVGGVMIAVGFQTRWAAFVCSGTMAVAYLQFHWKGQLDAGFFPIVNRGELAVVYAFVFLFIACKGPGPASVDGELARR
ncbi:MAG: DoxX family protein [Planctomycetia bacterium]|nr:DoxX family protein [Planctomycetia bacterium]